MGECRKPPLGSQATSRRPDRAAAGFRPAEAAGQPRVTRSADHSASVSTPTAAHGQCAAATAQDTPPSGPHAAPCRPGADVLKACRIRGRETATRGAPAVHVWLARDLASGGHECSQRASRRQGFVQRREAAIPVADALADARAH